MRRKFGRQREEEGEVIPSQEEELEEDIEEDEESEEDSGKPSADIEEDGLVEIELDQDFTYEGKFLGKGTQRVKPEIAESLSMRMSWFAQQEA